MNKQIYQKNKSTSPKQKSTIDHTRTYKCYKLLEKTK